MIRSRLPQFFLAPTTITGEGYATPYPTMSTSTGRGATVVQTPHLFADTAPEPRNFLHHDTVSGYGLAVSSIATACHHHNDDCANAQKLEIGSTLGHLLSIFIHPYPTPPFAYYKKGGRDPQPRGVAQRDDTTQWQCTKHTLKHSNTHPRTET
jgi:hypothetical protein